MVEVAIRAVRNFIAFYLTLMLLSRLTRIAKFKTLVKPQNPLDLEAKVVFVIHVYFAEYIEKIAKIAEQYPATQIVVSSSRDEIIDRLGDWLATQPACKITIVRCANRGRNFGGLWAAMPHIELGRKYVFHLHSKSSQGRLGRKLWAATCWNFAMSKQTFYQTVAAFETDRNIGTISPFSPLSFPWDFNWQGSDKAIEGLAKAAQFANVKLPFYYPVGGMFAMRRTDLQYTFELLGDLAFLEESDHQVTNIEYALERLISVIPQSRNRLNLAWVPELGQYVNGQDLAETVSHFRNRRDTDLQKISSWLRARIDLIKNRRP